MLRVFVDLQAVKFDPPNRLVLCNGNVLAERIKAHVERERVAVLVDAPLTAPPRLGTQVMSACGEGMPSERGKSSRALFGGVCVAGADVFGLQVLELRHIGVPLLRRHVQAHTTS